MMFTYFLPYSFTGHLPSHPALVRAYLRFRPAWRLFGKQFLVIAVRPGGGQAPDQVGVTGVPATGTTKHR